MACRAAFLVTVAAALLVGAAATPLVALAQPAGPRPVGSTRLLDVPYLSQTEDLCGGAAMSMVLRYWGDRRVQPADFAALVDRSAAGIRTDVLSAELSRRGWQAFPVAADASGEWIATQLDRGRPVIALIAISPTRFHYIVIVGWTPGQVIAHDPASAPFRVMATAEFERAWAAAGHWALLVLPGVDGSLLTTPAPPALPALPAAGACAPLIQNMVDLARAGQLAEAEPGLLAATQLCPLEAGAWRELAGIRFLQSRWDDAASLAERAAALEPDDEAGWDLVATSRFLNDEPEVALGAWGRIGRPTVDLVRVQGLARTRQPVIVRVLGLQPNTVLTTANLGRAARRLDELPSAVRTNLRYRPLAGGVAEIEAVVVERPRLPSGVVPIVATATRAWAQREVQVNAASPTGSGELFTIAWRWWEARPRVAMTLAVPAVSWWSGVTTIEGSWERQSYATAAVTSERRRAGVRVADWASRAVRWNAGVALDRWADDSHLSVDGALDVRLAGDRVSVGIHAEGWTPAGSGRRFATGRLSSAWRSTVSHDRPSWSVTLGLVTATATAPLDLWPGAGVGHARVPLLRAHPLLDAGVITGEVFGRQLAHGTVEYQHPLLRSPAGTLQLAVFGDTARAWRRLGTTEPSPLHADVGAGLRLALPGKGGALRVEAARGLRDKRMAFSARWQAPWPGTQDE
jgi:hypothetical protein